VVVFSADCQIKQGPPPQDEVGAFASFRTLRKRTSHTFPHTPDS